MNLIGIMPDNLANNCSFYSSAQDLPPLDIGGMLRIRVARLVKTEQFFLKTISA